MAFRVGHDARILLAGAGLHPSTQGKRIRFSGSPRRAYDPAAAKNPDRYTKQFLDWGRQGDGLTRPGDHALLTDAEEERRQADLSRHSRPARMDGVAPSLGGAGAAVVPVSAAGGRRLKTLPAATVPSRIIRIIG